MMRTTKYRRSRPMACLLALALVLGVITLFGAHQPAWGQDASQDESIESIAAIRAAAESYVKSLIPPGGENTATVGALDSRLRRPHCPAKYLTASLLAGLSLQAR